MRSATFGGGGHGRSSGWAKSGTWQSSRWRSWDCPTRETARPGGTAQIGGLSGGHLAAQQGEDLAGDVAAVRVRGEEDERRGDLLGLGGAAHGGLLAVL